MRSYRRYDRILLPFYMPLLAALGGATVFAIPASSAKARPISRVLSQHSNGLSLPAGFRSAVYARGLKAPTAMAFGPDGKLYVTELNGGENESTGEIVVLSRPGASPRVLLRHLHKPTGLVWRKKVLYIAAGRNVLRTALRKNGRLKKPVTVVHNLPDNGRSEGQIDLLPDGRLLYEASGNARRAKSSGMLFTLIPGHKPKVLASGLKNAYGHALDSKRGQLYTTDIEADSVNGKAAPDEIDAVRVGKNYGWPRCYADRKPAFNWGGSKRACVATEPPVLNLPPHATPTGLAYYSGSDFPKDYRDVLYVALWNGNPSQVMRVTLARRGRHMAGRATTFITGKGFYPIDVLPDPHGGLFVLDYEGGVVYRIFRSG